MILQKMGIGGGRVGKMCPDGRPEAIGIHGEFPFIKKNNCISEIRQAEHKKSAKKRGALQ
jgi:hypothetical protein